MPALTTWPSVTSPPDKALLPKHFKNAVYQAGLIGRQMLDSPELPFLGHYYQEENETGE